MLEIREGKLIKKMRPCCTWLLACMGSWTLIFGMVTGCQKKKTTAVKKDTLHLNFSQGDVPSLEPHALFLGGRSAFVGKCLFEGITRLNPQGEYELAGAESIEISPCKTHYTITLRPQFYSDGTAVSAYDYESCWKRALSPTSTCPCAHVFYLLKNGEDVKKGNLTSEHIGVCAKDDATLLVELHRPAPYFLQLLAMPLFAPYKMDGEKIVGSGPYVVDYWKRGDIFRLTKNPFFWDKDRIKIKNMCISMIKDEEISSHLYSQEQIEWNGPPFNAIPTERLEQEFAEGKLLKKIFASRFGSTCIRRSFQ